MSNCTFNSHNKWCSLFQKNLDNGKRLQECIDYRRGYDEKTRLKLNEIIKKDKLTISLF